MLKVIQLHMKSKILFAIPIYVRSLEEWHKDYDAREKQYLDQIEQNNRRAGGSLGSTERIQYQVWFNQSSSPWQYNEIIGFIEIRYLNNTLYGFLFKSQAKRYSPTLKNKKITLDTSFSPPSEKLDTNHDQEIKHKIQRIIDLIVRKNKKFRKYFVDTEIVQNVAPMLSVTKLSTLDDS